MPPSTVERGALTSMRSGYCVVTEAQVGQEVRLCGWVQRRRDHGGVIFLDIRDYQGVVQVVVDPDSGDCFNIAEHIRNEYVLQLSGTVRLRTPDTVNLSLPTGKLEVYVKHLKVLNAVSRLPFSPAEHGQIGEEHRLRYRYIDLRRTEMQQGLRLRSKMVANVRHLLDSHNFLEVETPQLTRSTPEGARDFLVPSRVQEGSFFALPQSPQLFKQFLMMSGIDRYYQIAKCFRDEDLRADRQPEFTQIDVEATFVEAEDIMSLTEDIMRNVFRQSFDIELPPFKHLSYQAAMEEFGSDRPDLRNPLSLVETSDLFQDVEFKVFSKPANDSTSRIAALKVAEGAALGRGLIDKWTARVRELGGDGLAWIKLLPDSGEFQSPIVKFLPEEVLTLLCQRLGAKAGDIIFFGAGKQKVVNETMADLRQVIGQHLNLLENDWQPLWVVDFPMFESNADGSRSALHHPFTAPACELDELTEAPDQALSKAYDFVLNGIEMGGGSVRIHEPKMQSKVLELLGMDKETAMNSFGFLIEALSHGCPPHAGIALGLDRLVMMACGAKSIRDVIAFPKTQSTSCLLTGAPTSVEQQQLTELKLRSTIKLSNQSPPTKQ